MQRTMRARIAADLQVDEARASSKLARAGWLRGVARERGLAVVA